MTLTKSKDILGLTLNGAAGAKLGVVRETFVDLATGSIGFLIVEGVSLLGGSGKYHPVPWTLVRHDPVAKAFQADLTKEQFKGSPSYDRDQLGNGDYGWDEQAAKYFNAAAPLTSVDGAG